MGENSQLTIEVPALVTRNNQSAQPGQPQQN